MASRLGRCAISNSVTIVAIALYCLACSQPGEWIAGFDFKAFVASTYSVETVVVPAVTAAVLNSPSTPLGSRTARKAMGTTLEYRCVRIS